jgi:hypothetical protein
VPRLRHRNRGRRRPRCAASGMPRQFAMPVLPPDAAAQPVCSPLHRQAPESRSVYAQAFFGAGGGGCRSTCCSPLSRQAQAGALAVQMFATGATEDGSSRVPTRTTVRPGRPVLSANRCDPQWAQNLRVTRLPLSPGLLYEATAPVLAMSCVGNIALGMPLPARCWQSRHQQMRATMGSDCKRYLTWPHKQPPVRSGMVILSTLSRCAVAREHRSASFCRIDPWTRPSEVCNCVLGSLVRAQGPQDHCSEQTVAGR